MNSGTEFRPSRHAGRDPLPLRNSEWGAHPQITQIHAEKEFRAKTAKVAKKEFTFAPFA